MIEVKIQKLLDSRPLENGGRWRPFENWNMPSGTYEPEPPSQFCPSPTSRYHDLPKELDHDLMTYIMVNRIIYDANLVECATSTHKYVRLTQRWFENHSWDEYIEMVTWGGYLEDLSWAG